MIRRLGTSLLTAAYFAGIGALLWLAYFGERTAVAAIRALSTGKETGPLGDVYPGWSLWHFVSALVFLALALLQTIPVLRSRYPLAHRISGRIAIVAALTAALSAVMIAMVAEGRPIFWRLWVAFQFVAIAALLLLGLAEARNRRYRRHQTWMVRSIAFALAVLTQRLVFPIFPAVFGIHSDEQFWAEFTGAAVLATGINLAVAETWLRVSAAKQQSPAILAPSELRAGV